MASSASSKTPEKLSRVCRFVAVAIAIAVAGAMTVRGTGVAMAARVCAIAFALVLALSAYEFLFPCSLAGGTTCVAMFGVKHGLLAGVAQGSLVRLAIVWIGRLTMSTMSTTSTTSA